MFDWYPEFEYLFARTQLVLFMLGMGLTLSLGDFVEIARRPRSFCVGLLGQLFIVPWIAVAINYFGDLEPGVAIGMILVAAMPGGAMSKFFAYLGRGNMALSISLTGVTTLLTLITVPLMLKLLASQHTPSDFTMPIGAIVIDVAMCLLLPLLVGLVIGRIVPKHRVLLSKICIRVGLVVVAAMVISSLGSGRINPAAYGFRVPIAIILLCILGQQINMLPFRWFGWPREDRMAVGIEITMRNMNLALLIKAEMFPSADELGNGVLFVVLYYAATAMIAGVPLALNSRRQARKEAVLAPAPAHEPASGKIGEASS